MNIKELFETKDKLQSFAKDTFNVAFAFDVLTILKNNDRRYTDLMMHCSRVTTLYPKVDIEKELSVRDNDLGYGKEYIYEDDTYKMRFILSL